MTRKEARRRHLQSELHILERQHIGSGYLLEQEPRLEQVRLELARLDDFENIPGPLDLVNAVDGCVTLTPNDRRWLEKIFRSAIAEHIHAALQVGPRQRTSERGISLGSELQ